MRDVLCYGTTFTGEARAARRLTATPQQQFLALRETQAPQQQVTSFLQMEAASASSSQPQETPWDDVDSSQELGVVQLAGPTAHRMRWKIPFRENRRWCRQIQIALRTRWLMRLVEVHPNR